jgi:hypothetical protein
MPGPFDTLIVNGPYAGKVVALMCDLTVKPRPSVFVFARNRGEPVVRLIKRLDAEARQSQTLMSIMFFSEEEKAPELANRLKVLAEQEKIDVAVLSVWRKLESPPRWQIADEAEVTVVLFTRNPRVVAVNLAFRKGELTDQGIEQVVAALKKIVPTIAPKGGPR